MPSSKRPRQRTPEAQKQEIRARAATEDVSRKEREAQCLQLRIQGWSFERIAKQVGYANSGGAYKAWKRALADIPKQSADEAREHLRLQLEDVSVTLMTLTHKGNTRAAEALVKLQERYCRMLNLDIQPKETSGAPVVLEIPESIAQALRGQTAQAPLIPPTATSAEVAYAG